MGLKIFGYPGCTTVKKANSWAEENSLAFHYTHFSKVDDLEEKLNAWITSAGIDKIFNSKAQTFKKLSVAEQAAIVENTDTMIAAMVKDPRLIKRPVGTDGAHVLAGFNKDEWQDTFGQ